MHIVVNGDPVDVAVRELNGVLQSLGYGSKKVAVAINQEFIEREQWSEYQVEDGDVLDVLSPIEGG